MLNIAKIFSIFKYLYQPSGFFNRTQRHRGTEFFYFSVSSENLILFSVTLCLCVQYNIIPVVLLYYQREPDLPSGLEPNSGCRWFL